MPPIINYTDVLPLRAIAFQLLFLFMAIAIEAAVLNERLNLGRKLSMQYAATVNLLSTVMGWVLLFVVEPWLPSTARQTLVEYVFFGVRSVPPIVYLIGFTAFILTFALKLQGIELLELLLEKTTLPVAQESNAPRKFQGRKKQLELSANSQPNRPMAVLWANAFSFVAITVILIIRVLVDQINPIA
jgi:hypothetical protein